MRRHKQRRRSIAISLPFTKSSSSASPPSRPRSRGRSRKRTKPQSSWATQEELPPIYETQEEQVGWATSHDPPVMGMSPTAEYVAWRQQAYKLESETPDCEHIPEQWEPDWTSSEWEPPWESWASDAECSPPEREPVCPSTQGQPAVGPSANDSPLPNSWGLGVDRRTPNFTADGRRVKRPRGGARERSHNGYYRRPSGA